MLRKSNEKASLADQQKFLPEIRAVFLGAAPTYLHLFILTIYSRHDVSISIEEFHELF